MLKDLRPKKKLNDRAFVTKRRNKENKYLAFLS